MIAINSDVSRYHEHKVYTRVTSSLLEDNRRQDRSLVTYPELSRDYAGSALPAYVTIAVSSAGPRIAGRDCDRSAIDC